MTRTTALLLAVFSVVTIAGCTAFQKKSFGGKAEATASAAELRALSVENRNGSIEVVQAEGVAGAEVTAEIRAFASTPAEAHRRTAEAKLVAEHDASGTLRVRVDFPAPAHPSDSASITVRAARADRLELVSSNGAIACEGFAAPLGARTSNGAIRVDRHSGDMDLVSSNGRIEVKRSTGGVQANTSNGRIEIALDEGATGDVTARTSNGAITLELPASWQGSVEANTSNGSVELDAGDRGSAVKSSRDSARMTLGNAAAAKAILRTSNGAIRVTAAGGER
jgi:DUF4097 and DUF4098 domain-containing protein YvlB